MKSAVVTGASSGIGAATARELARLGFQVFCAARREDRVKALADEIGGTPVVCDVTDAASVAELASAVGPRLDVLVNNAGGAFALASALIGYSSVTDSPIWLKLIVFFGAGALGGSIPSSLDTDMENIQIVLASAGGVLVLLGLIGVAVRGRRTEPDEVDPKAHGRRAAR